MVNVVAVLILVVFMLGLVFASFGAGFMLRPYADKLRPPKAPVLTPEEKVELDKLRGEAKDRQEHMKNLFSYRGKPQKQEKKEGVK